MDSGTRPLWRDASSVLAWNRRDDAFKYRLRLPVHWRAGALFVFVVSCHTSPPLAYQWNLSFVIAPCVSEFVAVGVCVTNKGKAVLSILGTLL